MDGRVRQAARAEAAEGQEGQEDAARDGPEEANRAGIVPGTGGRVTVAADDHAVPMPRGRRRTELVMLAFALAVVLFAYSAVGLGLRGKLPPGLPTDIIVFAALMVGAHLAVRRLAPYADPLLLPLAALLNGLGLVMIYRLNQSGRNGNPGNLVTDMPASATSTQLLYTGLGVVALIVVLVLIREARVLQRYTYTLGALGLLLLAVPAVLPASHSVVNGAKVWIIIGGFSVEPGEFARLALAVFFAGYLVAKRDALALAGSRVLGIDLPRGRDLGPVLLAWARQPADPHLRD